MWLGVYSNILAHGFESSQYCRIAASPGHKPSDPTLWHLKKDIAGGDFIDAIAGITNIVIIRWQQENGLTHNTVIK